MLVISDTIFDYIKKYFFADRMSIFSSVLLFVLVSSAYGRPESGLESGSPCPGPPEKGPCNSLVHKWAYDPEKGACVMFVWGGCAGNDKNRFDNEIQCMKSCAGANCKYKQYKAIHHQDVGN